MSLSQPLAGISKLRKAHPWPASKPTDTVPLSGWLGEGNKRLLRQAISERKPEVIVELGSWLGLSATFFAQEAPKAQIICVDTWEGSQEHQGGAQFAPVLGKLHGSFLANLWPHQDRVVAIRAFSWDGLQAIHDQGIVADLIYVDASHETNDVMRDLDTAWRLFPNAVVLGDDWGWPSVRRAVVPFAKKHGLRVNRDKNCYRLAAQPRPGALHYAALRVGTAWKSVDRVLIWPIVRRVRPGKSAT
ncbi:MAG: class I SAM-dependent methyltransferase [Halobacteriales archaeon]|nr:class I SAM-dependent methyltransferase [Halobacteriales archaeon]